MVWTQHNLNVLQVILILFFLFLELRQSQCFDGDWSFWSSLKGSRGRIFCFALSTASFSWRKKKWNKKKKNPGALRNARFHVLIIKPWQKSWIFSSSKAKVALIPERTRSCAGDKESGSVLQSLCFQCSTCWVNGKGRAGIASPPSSLHSPGLGLASLLFDVDAEFSAKPQISPFPAILLCLSLGKEPPPNAFKL